jgi:NTP pyrophosphatase (non-canonical NTP hydrolase)
MNFNEYQEACKQFAVYGKSAALSSDDSKVIPINVTYCALGLASEAGEVAGVIKKAIRDDEYLVQRNRFAPDRFDKLLAELGDVMWYASQLATELGVKLEDVCIGNIDKLTARKEKGTLQGSGDNR